jgi:hypothetical protein
MGRAVKTFQSSCGNNTKGIIVFHSFSLRMPGEIEEQNVLKSSIVKRAIKKARSIYSFNAILLIS